MAIITYIRSTDFAKVDSFDNGDSCASFSLLCNSLDVLLFDLENGLKWAYRCSTAGVADSVISAYILAFTSDARSRYSCYGGTVIVSESVVRADGSAYGNILEQLTTSNIGTICVVMTYIAFRIVPLIGVFCCCCRHLL